MNGNVRYCNLYENGRHHILEVGFCNLAHNLLGIYCVYNAEE